MDLIELRREFLENNHSKIIESLQILRTLRNLESTRQHHAFDALDRLNSLGFQTQEVFELWSEIAQLLKNSDYSGRTLTAQEREYLLRSIEELRLRIVSVAVIGARSVDLDHGQTSEVDWFRLKDYSPTIEHHSGNIVSAAFRSHVVILLPEVESLSTEQAVANGLLDIFERASGQKTWIIDFSAMRQITHLMLGLIYGYRENLNRKGGRLGVCWLRDGIVPGSLMNSVSNKLELIRIGDHWFSVSLSSS